MSELYTGIIFKSVDSIIEVLNKPENIQLDPVRQLLATYNKIKEKEAAKQTSDKKYPLLVFEGLDGCGKSTTTKRLAGKLNAKVCRTPPESLMTLRPLFDGDDYKKLRPIFYALGNYIAALEMKTMLQRQPVILDRFWHSTACFAIAQAIEDEPEKYEMPPANDDIYSWPKDLLLPDKIFFLSISEKTRLIRLGGRQEFTTQEHLLKAKQVFRDNIVELYKRMFDPKITIVNGQQTKGKVEKELMTHLQHMPEFNAVATRILSN